MRRDPSDSSTIHPDDKLKQQIDRDRTLLDLNPDEGVRSVTWHFLSSQTPGQIASDPLLFRYLQDNQIPYVIHLPTSAP